VHHAVGVRLYIQRALKENHGHTGYISKLHGEDASSVKELVGLVHVASFLYSMRRECMDKV